MAGQDNILHCQWQICLFVRNPHIIFQRVEEVQNLPLMFLRLKFLDWHICHEAH